MNKYYWIVESLGYWSMAFLLIPLRTMKKLFFFGFIGGFLYTLVVQLLAVWVFKKWEFTPEVFTVWRIPFFFLLCWFGVTMSLGYFLLKFPKYQIAIVLSFAAIGTLKNYFGEYFRMISMNGWSLLDTFMFAVFSHVLILYLFKLLFHKKEIGAQI